VLGDDPVVAQAGDKGDCFPMSVGDRCDQPLTARTAASGGGLVNKHQPGGVKQALLSYPPSTGASDIGSLGLMRCNKKRLFNDLVGADRSA
jgi:hypothetical protein